MKRLAFLVVLVSATLCVAADEEIGRRENSYDKVVFSRPAIFVAWGLWGYTTYQLQEYPEEYEGIGRSSFGDHLHLGFALHMLGYMTYNYFPGAWDDIEPGAKMLYRLGWMIQLDDVVQHLVIQRRDNFGPGLTGQYKIGLVQKAYRWAIEPRRDNDRIKVMLTLVSVGRNNLSVGYFQGPAAQISFGQVGVLPGMNFSSILLASYGYCRKTELAIEQILIGPEVEARFYKKIYLSAFAGVRMLDKRAGARVERLAYGWGINWGR